jgi:hypothetical protein
LANSLIGGAVGVLAGAVVVGVVGAVQRWRA